MRSTDGTTGRASPPTRPASTSCTLRSDRSQVTPGLRGRATDVVLVDARTLAFAGEHRYVLAHISASLHLQMSLQHDFLLVSTDEYQPSDYARFIGSDGATHLHDDLLRYMADALGWVPTLNPAKNEPGTGLNFHGPTVILADGAPLAERVFRAWAQLFSLGPEELVLTGPWTTVEGSPRSGQYSRLRFPRATVVTALERLAEDCKRVRDSGGGHFLLHIGI